MIARCGDRLPPPADLLKQNPARGDRAGLASLQVGDLRGRAPTGFDAGRAWYRLPVFRRASATLAAFRAGCL